MWNENNAKRYFPNSDGSFDIKHEDVQAGSRILIELPDTGPSAGPSHSGTNVWYRNSLGCLSPRAGKRLRFDGAGTVESDSNVSADVLVEILKLRKELLELKGSMGRLLGDIGTLRRDVAMLLSQPPT